MDCVDLSFGSKDTVPSVSVEIKFEMCVVYFSDQYFSGVLTLPRTVGQYITYLSLHTPIDVSVDVVLKEGDYQSVETNGFQNIQS